MRIAGSFSSAKRDEWKESIDKFQHDPLTPDAERSMEELQSWYKKDMDTKDEVEKLRNVMESLNKNDRDTKDEMEKLTNEVKQVKIKDEQRSVILEQVNLKQEQLNVKQEQLYLKQEQMYLKQEQMYLKQQEQTNTTSQQVINIVINCESFQAAGPSISPDHLSNEPQLQESGWRYDMQSEREERECVVAIPMEQTQAEGAAGQSGVQLQTNQQELDFWYVLYSFKEPIRLLVRYLKFKLGVDIQDNQLGSLVITVSCSTLQVLERLWDDYCSGHLNEVIQQTLVTAEVLEELGLSEVKLKTIISEEEYKACREFFMQSSGNLEIHCSR